MNEPSSSNCSEEVGYTINKYLDDCFFTLNPAYDHNFRRPSGEKQSLITDVTDAIAHQQKNNTGSTPSIKANEIDISPLAKEKQIHKLEDSLEVVPQTKVKRIFLTYYY